jgi:small-conductance mechanosensitive channel
MSEFLIRHWEGFLLPATVFLSIMLVALIARRFIFRMLDRWVRKSETELDDIVVDALRRPFLLWSLILSLSVATQISVLPVRVTNTLNKGFLILWVISFTLVATRLAGSLVRHYGANVKTNLPVTTLTQNLARLAVATVGILILLNLLGVSITPILTALGVGGLAVALALQDTLSNLFAGFYVSIAGQVRVNDYIKLNSGEEGYVQDISWRSTSIRALANNLIIVPNAKLAQAIVTNYHLPEKRMSLLIPISVDYECDPARVEEILVDEATRAAGKVPGLLADPPPFVRFIPGFGDSSLNFTLICQVGEFVDQYLAQHELRKRIFLRFRREGINIPFPVRTVHLRSVPESLQKAAPAAAHLRAESMSHASRDAR